ncbi:MAG TPA: hypothetical protein VG815_14955 [Chloroflexota bacterium]|nr:hypothetical protein [Chloroflexota bacterium]
MSVEGFSVTTVCDEQEALRVLEESQPDMGAAGSHASRHRRLAPATEIHRHWPVSIIAMSASRAMLGMAD